MSVKIDLNSVSNKEYGVNHIQYIPCNIEHNGEAAVEKYFSKYVREETSQTTENEGDEEKGTVPK